MDKGSNQHRNNNVNRFFENIADGIWIPDPGHTAAELFAWEGHPPIITPNASATVDWQTGTFSSEGDFNSMLNVLP